jgi:TPR repeat protein
MNLRCSLSLLVLVSILLLLSVVRPASASDHSANLEMEKNKCDLGDSQTCFILGGEYDKGIGVEQDSLLAAKFFKKACEYGEGAGCSKLGQLYQHGKGVKLDTMQALGYYKKACELDDEQGCKNYITLEKQKR